jgi:chromosome segregation ATPase
MKTKRFITLALGCMMLAAPAYLAAQQDQESVADAARKAQAEKKNAPKAKLTIDNDNLSTLTGTVNVVGEAPAPPEDQTKKPAAPKTGAPAKDEAYWRDKFADANKKLADDAHELDITQREFNLKQQQFYTDPMASLKQEYSRQDINDTKTKIDELTAKVAQDKTDISNLEDELRQAGGDPGWATPPSQPVQAQPATGQPATDQPVSTQPPEAQPPVGRPAVPPQP